MKLENFKGPFTVSGTNTDTTRFVYDASGEMVAKVTAPDDNRAGIKFAADHAELLGSSHKMLEDMTNIYRLAAQTGGSLEDLLQNIASIAVKYTKAAA